MSYLISAIAIFALIFLWTYFSGGEKEHTIERAKNSLGCSVMFLGMGLFVLAMILGTFKMCSDALDADDGTEIDYYDDAL